LNTEKLEKYNTMYMDVAYRVRQMSHCTRLQVGAIIVKDDNIISFGWNGTPKGHCNNCEDDNNVTLPSVIHAERNTLNKLQNHPSLCEASTLFSTAAPCLSCAQLIVERGITHVAYGELYRTQDGLDYLVHQGIIIQHVPI
jgi:dCMP deaminase